LEESHSQNRESYTQQIKTLQEQVASLKKSESQMRPAEEKIAALILQIRSLKAEQVKLESDHRQKIEAGNVDLVTISAEIKSKIAILKELEEKVIFDEDRYKKLESAIGNATMAMARIEKLTAANAYLQEQLDHCSVKETIVDKEQTLTQWVWNGGPCPLVVKCLSLLRISALGFLRPYEKPWQPDFEVDFNASASDLYFKMKNALPKHKIAVKFNEDASITFEEMPLQTLVTKQQKILRTSLGVTNSESKSLKNVEEAEGSIVDAFVNITTNWYYYQQGIGKQPTPIDKSAISANKENYKLFLRGQYPHVDIMIDYFFHDYRKVYANTIKIVYKSGVNVACAPFRLENVGVLMPPSRPGESMGLYFALMFSNNTNCFLTGTYDSNSKTLILGHEDSTSDRGSIEMQSYVKYVLYFNFWSNFAKHYPITNRRIESRYARALDLSRSSLNIDHAQDVLNGLVCE
jgi:hypothetical protein